MLISTCFESRGCADFNLFKQGAAGSPQFCCQRRRLWILREADWDANLCTCKRVLRILWIVAMGLSQEPHNMFVMMFDCSSVLSGYPGHLGNFFIIVVEFWKVSAQAVGYITFRHFSVCVCVFLRLLHF